VSVQRGRCFYDFANGLWDRAEVVRSVVVTLHGEGGDKGRGTVDGQRLHS